MSREASTLATFILPIAKALRVQGLDPMELLEQADIDPSHVINDDRRVPVANMQQLWRLATAATGDEAFGLRAAEQIQPGTLQGLGLAVLVSDTIYEGLERLVRFSRVLSSGFVLSLEERGDFVDLTFLHQENELSQEFSWQSYDFGLGVVLVMCRLTLGEYLSPFMIETTRRRRRIRTHLSPCWVAASSSTLSASA